MAAASLGLWLTVLTPIILVLPDRVGDLTPDSKSTNLSIVLGFGALAGLVANPLVGWFSDRSVSRFGMRRPFLLGTSVAAAAGLLVIAAAGSIPVLTLGWCITAGAANGMMAVLYALLPDHIPVQRRGFVSGLFGMTQAAAGVIGTVVASTAPLGAALGVLGLFGVLSAVWLVVVLPDRVAETDEHTPFSLRKLAGSFWVNPVRYPNFGWAWINRFLIFMSVSSVINYQLYYLTDTLGLHKDHAGDLVTVSTALQTVAVLLTAAVAGRISDRVGRRRVFVLGAALLAAAGMLALVFNPSETGFLIAMVMIAVGEGVYFAVDLALATQVLPDSEQAAGKDLGVFNLANQLPQSLAPAVAPLFLAIGGTGHNYTALYTVGTLYAIVGAFSILRVRGVR
ncbi:MFS transporter [Streptomyces sp. NPDC058464]|uniref:MFS transporter n=1 Tax=Streptomyces sp. NPDC058464 TaxID=3346511 RepID=UPI0036619933